MEKTQSKEKLLPGLCLGTVQLGMKYGINNKEGKPSREKSFAILDLAYKRGIRVFDTANAYGDAEEILGEFITTRKIKDKVEIISKLRPHVISPENAGNAQKILELIEAEIRKSLQRIRRDYLDGYLLHTPEYIYNDKIVAALRACKAKGLVKNIGVSIYEEADALYAVNNAAVDYIQLPYSVFDQRLNKTGFFEAARKNKVKVFARSAFLQGLVFMEKERIPDYLEEAKQHLETFDKIIKQHGLSRTEASLLFSYNNPYIDSVVFGVDNTNQLNEDIDIVQKELKFDECMKELTNRFTNIKKSIIFPSLWKSHPAEE